MVQKVLVEAFFAQLGTKFLVNGVEGKAEVSYLYISALRLRFTMRVCERAKCLG